MNKRGIKNLTGIEPGNHKLIEGLNNIRLINDFFPSKQISDKFDLIYLLLVLEHIEDPVLYIQELTESLNENGKIIFAVPNCEPYLKDGDLSIFIHEHFSYFTTESIINLISKTNFKVEDISIIEGLFIVTISQNDIDHSINFQIISEEYFNDKINFHIASLKRIFENYSQSEIAIYAPTRAINSLYLSNYVSVRLVDDNTRLQGKYLPSLISQVESFDDIVSKPPKCLLIFSRTFGERIKQKCVINKKLNNTLILTLNDLDTDY